LDAAVECTRCEGWAPRFPRYAAVPPAVRAGVQPDRVPPLLGRGPGRLRRRIRWRP